MGNLESMSSAFIFILSILAAIGLPWPVGIPLAVIGIGYLVWPRKAKKEAPPPDGGKTGFGRL